MLTRYVFLRILAEIGWNWVRDTISVMVICYLILFMVLLCLQFPSSNHSSVSYPPVKNLTPDHVMAFELIWAQFSADIEAALKTLHKHDPSSQQVPAEDRRGDL